CCRRPKPCCSTMRNPEPRLGWPPTSRRQRSRGLSFGGPVGPGGCLPILQGGTSELYVVSRVSSFHPVSTLLASEPESPRPHVVEPNTVGKYDEHHQDDKDERRHQRPCQAVPVIEKMHKVRDDQRRLDDGQSHQHHQH